MIYIEVAFPSWSKRRYRISGQGAKDLARDVSSTAGAAVGTALTAGIPYGVYKAGTLAETTALGSEELLGTLVDGYSNGMEALGQGALYVGDLITPAMIDSYLQSMGAWSVEAAQGVKEWLSALTPDMVESFLSEGLSLGSDVLLSGSVGAALTYKLPILINVVGQGLLINTFDKIKDTIAGTSSAVKRYANYGGWNNAKRYGKVGGASLGALALVPATVFHAARSGVRRGKEFLQCIGKAGDSYLGIAEAVVSSSRRIFSGQGGFRNNLKASRNDLKKARNNIFEHSIERKKTGVARIDAITQLGYQETSHSDTNSDSGGGSHWWKFRKKKKKKKQTDSSGDNSQSYKTGQSATSSGAGGEGADQKSDHQKSVSHASGEKDQASNNHGEGGSDSDIEVDNSGQSGGGEIVETHEVSDADIYYHYLAYPEQKKGKNAAGLRKDMMQKSDVDKQKRLRGYVESIRMLSEQDLDKYQQLAQTLKKKFTEQMNAMDLSRTEASKTDTRAYRDIAKKLYYHHNPSEQTEPDKYPPFNPLTSSEDTNQGMIDIMIGYDILFANQPSDTRDEALSNTYQKLNKQLSTQGSLHSWQYRELGEVARAALLDQASGGK